NRERPRLPGRLLPCLSSSSQVTDSRNKLVREIAVPQSLAPMSEDINKFSRKPPGRACPTTVVVEPDGADSPPTRRRSDPVRVARLETCVRQNRLARSAEMSHQH